MADHYSKLGDVADSTIENYVELIRNEIVENFPSLTCILLCGGFGRGEGSVLVENGAIRPLKDLDFMVIFPELPSEKVSALQENLRLRLGKATPEQYAYSTFSVDLNSTTLDRINMYPDITTYEAKVASKFVYGEDIRDRIKITNEIPLRSGARILFQKAISLVGQMADLDFIDKKSVPSDRRNMFIYESNKVFVELGTALSILGHIYHPSYEKRADLLKEHYSALFPELHNQLPDLADKVFESTQLKLNPDFSKLTDPLSLWFEARKYHKHVFCYYMQKYLGLSECMDFPSFCLKTRQGLINHYYLPLVSISLEKRFHLKATRFPLWFVNRGFQLSENLAYMRNKGFLNYLSQSKIRLSSPVIDFFTAVILLLHSLHDSGCVERETIALGRKMMRLSSIPLLESSDKSVWSENRLLCLENLKYLPGVF